jgi:hypothetical protein
LGRGNEPVGYGADDAGENGWDGDGAGESSVRIAEEKSAVVGGGGRAIRPGGVWDMLSSAEQ